MARNRRVAAGEYALLFGADPGAAAGGQTAVRGRLMPALVGVGVVLLWFAVTGPARRDVNRLRTELSAYQADFTEMQSLFRAYTRLRDEDGVLQQRVLERAEDFALFGHVTDVAERQGLQLASLRPSARPVTDQWQVERVKVELDEVPLPALVAFLYALTDPGAVVRIDGFELRGGVRGLNVSFEAQTLTLRR